MTERKKFKPEDLGPLSEKPNIPETCKVEGHRGHMVVVWRVNNRVRSGFIGPDGTWNITR